MAVNYLSSISKAEFEHYGTYCFTFAGEPYFFQTVEAAKDWHNIGFAEAQLDMLRALKDSRAGETRDTDDSERGWRIRLLERSGNSLIWALERLESP